MKKEYVYRAFERFWHWTQAALIIFLGVTGFEIHGSIHFFGYDQAVRYHNIAAISFLVLIVFAIFWHFTTGEWRQYLPTWKNLRAQAEYYIFGIFRNAPHPDKKNRSEQTQSTAEAGLCGTQGPRDSRDGHNRSSVYVLSLSAAIRGVSLNIGGLQVVATLHTIGAFLLVSFFIAHLYLITTGNTVTSNLKAMITGYEDLSGESDEERNKNP